MSQPLKIVRLIARLNVGGPARHVMLLNRGLQARGHKALLVHGEVGPGEASLECLTSVDGLRVVKIADLGARVSVIGDVRALAAIIRIIFRESPDVIHTHTAKAGVLGRLSAAIFNATRRRSRRALVVHTFHGHVLSGYFGSVGSALVRAAERFLARMSDCIVTISPSQRRDIVERFRVAPGDLVVTIPLGLDLELLLTGTPQASRIREQLAVPSSDFVIGYVGRFVPIKDLTTLVNAFHRTAREIPNARLLLVGDGPMRPRIEKAVVTAGLADRVHFLGWTDDLASVYATIDVCALTSRNEGTPVSLIEAMAAGKAVIATAVGGVPDLIADGRTGMLVPPQDPQAFAKGLLKLASEPELRLRLACAAREDVARRFALGRLIEDLDRLYVDRIAIKRGTIPH